MVKNFGGKHKAINYEAIANKMLRAYADMVVTMPLKVHFLHYHLDFFSENNADVSDEHGENLTMAFKSLEVDTRET